MTLRRALRRPSRGFFTLPAGLGTPRGGGSAETGLLAGYTTGLWGAYGLQKLRDLYTGPCIRVRRSSDNTEQDIGFSGSALDTAALASFVGANDGFIRYWYDQSGNARDLGQSTNSKQPQIVDAGTFMNEICFDAVDDDLVTATNATATDRYTTYMAGRERSLTPTGSGFRVLFQQDNGAYELSNERSAAGGSSDDYRSQAAVKNARNRIDDALTSHATTICLVGNTTESAEADEAKVYLNGAQAGSIGTNGSASTGNLTAGPLRLASSGSGSYARLACRTVLHYDAGHTTDIAPISTAIKPAQTADALDNNLTSLWGLYSLRRLRGSYAGSCIRVRRSSDNTEQDIGFASGVLDTAALASFVGANSAYVVTWYDQSGNGNNFAQATQANQPRIVNAGTVDRGITFDGSNDQMSSVNASGTPSAFTVYVVANNEVDPGTYAMVVGHSTAYDSQGGFIVYRSNSNTLGVGMGNNGGSNYATQLYDINPVGQVMCFRGDRSEATSALKNVLFSGGVKFTASSSSSGGTLPSGNYQSRNWYIGAEGAAAYATGDYETVAIYETSHADATVERVSRAVEGAWLP
jgi:hypothetical protein